MRTLVLDTSTNLLYISFIENNKVIYEINSMGLNNHSDHLLPLIEEGLKKNKLSIKDFDKIILGVGPGAYTGLRVSMSVAKMFSWTLNIPLYIISSLDLLSSGYKDNGKYIVKIKAKKGFIYYKSFEIKNGTKQVIENDMFVSEDYIEKYGEATLISNDNLLVNSLNINEKELQLVDNVHALEPNYLREC